MSFFVNVRVVFPLVATILFGRNNGLGILPDNETYEAVAVIGLVGGEKFIIILPNTDIEGAQRMAEEIREAVASMAIPHEKSTVESYVTLSLGVASAIPQENIPPEKLVIKADEALYAAKAAGRNCVCS